MGKYFKSRFTSGQTTNDPSKPKINIEFFQLIKTYLKSSSNKLILNIPETIIMNNPDKIPYLLYIDSAGFLSLKDKISSE